MRRFLMGSVVAAGVFAAVSLGAAKVTPYAEAPQAQATGMNADGLYKAWGTYQTMRQASPYRTATWQSLGPTNISGRATDVAVADVGDSRHLYVGYATSGVWKSEDHGKTWKAIFDNQASTSIGNVEVA